MSEMARTIKSFSAAAAVLSMLVTLACAAMDGGRVSTKPAESYLYEHPMDIVLRAAMHVLERKGYGAFAVSRDADTITSDYVVDGPFRSRAMAKAVQKGTNKTELRLRIWVEKKRGSGWEPQPVYVSTYEELFEEIDTQAYREYLEKMKESSTQ